MAWAPTGGGFVHSKLNSSSIDVVQRLSEFAQKVGGNTVSAGQKPADWFPAGIGDHFYDIQWPRPDELSTAPGETPPGWWNSTNGQTYYNRGYYSGNYNAGSDPDAEIHWETEASWLPYLAAGTTNPSNIFECWNWGDWATQSWLLCFENMASIKAWVRRFMGLAQWTIGSTGEHGIGSKITSVLVDTWPSYVVASTLDGAPGACPLLASGGAFCQRTDHAHDVVSVAGLHPHVVGWAIWASLILQFYHKLGMGVSAGLWEWDTLPTTQVMGPLSSGGAFNAVYGQGGSSAVSLSLYCSTTGQYETVYPTTSLIVPDTWGQEHPIIPPAWEFCGTFPGADNGTPWTNATATRNFVTSYRPDLAAAGYTTPECVVFSLGDPYETVRCNDSEFIASGAIAALYGVTSVLHHISGQDVRCRLFDGYQNNRSLGGVLAMLISYWDSKSGVELSDRAISPDLSTWTGCNSLTAYTSVRQDWPDTGDTNRPWSKITQQFVGTHFGGGSDYGDAYTLWVAWQDAQAGVTWELGPGVQIDTSRDVELVLVPTSGTYANQFTWQSRADWGQQEASNNAGAGHVMIEDGELKLTNAGRMYHLQAPGPGRIGYKIPITVDGGGGDPPGDDTTDPSWSAPSPAQGQTDFPNTADLEITVGDFGTGATGIDASTITCEYDGTPITGASLTVTYINGGQYRVTADPGTMANGQHSVEWYAEDYAENDSTRIITFTVADVPAQLIPPPPRNFRVVSVVWDQVLGYGRVTFAWELPDYQPGEATIDGYYILHNTVVITELPAHWLDAVPSVSDVVPAGSTNTCIWTGDEAQTGCTIPSQVEGMHYVAASSYHQI